VFVFSRGCLACVCVRMLGCTGGRFGSLGLCPRVPGALLLGVCRLASLWGRTLSLVLSCWSHGCGGCHHDASSCLSPPHPRLTVPASSPPLPASPVPASPVPAPPRYCLRILPPRSVSLNALRVRSRSFRASHLPCAPSSRPRLSSRLSRCRSCRQGVRKGGEMFPAVRRIVWDAAQGDGRCAQQGLVPGCQQAPVRLQRRHLQVALALLGAAHPVLLPFLA
jgi:hypothetical protein